MHHHATFVVTSDAGTNLYVAGGANSATAFLYGAGRSQVQPDGTLGAWAATTSLPRSLVGPSVAVMDTTVVVAGGMTSSHALSTTTSLSVVQPDGELGPWQDGPELPEGRMHHTTVSAGPWLYLVGGQGASGPIASVHRARLTGPGTIDGWVELTPLPQPRSHHSVAVSGNLLFLTGGMTPGSDAAQRERDVLRAEVQEDGSLGDWVAVGQLPARLSVHSSFVHNGWLFVAGGLIDGDEPSGELFRARIQPDGSLEPWEAGHDSLPFPRAHVHQTPVVDERFLYSVGGMVSASGESSPAVWVGRFE